MYDVVVIGCGPGGYAAAIRASQLGGRAAVVEAGVLGGTCVNRGCIPSKVWLRAAHIINIIQRAKDFGIQADVKKLDFKVINERKNGVVSDIKTGMEELLKKNGAEIIRGQGVIENPGEVKVDDKRLTTKNIILATGSSIYIPDINGLKEAVLNTDQILEMLNTPASVIVYGEAGPIDLEMASLLNLLGATVVLATPNSRILSKEDYDTSQRLTQALREQGIKILTRTDLTSIKKYQRKFHIVLSGREDHTLEIENVVISNRKPNTHDLGLRQVGIRLNEDGTVWVNEKLQTSFDGIYAIGDITGGWMNSHAASAMGITAAENAMGQNKDFPSNLIPRGLWTSPQMGSVGLTEENAEKKGFEVATGDFPYSINGLAMGYGEVDGAVKVVIDAKTEEILGIHIVGPNATELVGEAVMALQLECTSDELAHTIRVHPTFSEALMDAARDASGWALYLPPNV
jgi:dihydrolipoamide dehydrogenase